MFKWVQGYQMMKTNQLQIKTAQKDGIYFTCRFWKVEPFQLFSVEYKSINNNDKNYKNITWSSCKKTLQS